MLEDELSSLSIQEEDHQQNTNSKRRVALPDTPFSDDDISRYGRTDFVTMGHSPLLKTVSFKGLKAFKLGKALPKTTDETDELLI